MSKHVAVLMGGWSAEREVSLRSGKAPARTRSSAPGLSRQPRSMSAATSRPCCSTLKPDVAFNVLHGTPGRGRHVAGHPGDPRHPLHAIPACSPPRWRCRRTSPSGDAGGRRSGAGRHGGDAPRPPPGAPDAAALRHQAGGGGLQRRRVHRHRAARSSAAGADRDDWAFGERVLVERYIPGKELTCAVMGDKALDVIEIVAATQVLRLRGEIRARRLQARLCRRKFRRLFTKRSAGWRSRRIAPSAAAGVSRADFRYDDRSAGAEGLFCLEVNTQPGMTETSLVPELAAHAGPVVRRAGALDGRGRLAEPVISP